MVVLQKNLIKLIFIAWKFSRIFFSENGCKLPKLSVYRGTQNNNNPLMFIKRKFNFDIV